MKKKYFLGLFAILATAILGAGLVSAQGMGLMKNNGLSEEDMEAHKIAVETSVETGNYASWEGLMQDRISWMEDFVTEENFEMLQAQHQEREEFRAAVQELKDSENFTFEDMEVLREQYGIEGKGMGQGERMMQKMNSGNGMKQGSGNFARA